MKSIFIMAITLCIASYSFGQADSSGSSSGSFPNHKKTTKVTKTGSDDISTPGNSTSSDKNVISNGTNGLDRTTGKPSKMKMNSANKNQVDSGAVSNGTNGIDRPAADSSSTPAKQ